METYELGSSGAEVAKIQTALKGIGLYHGPIDAVFGGATEAAVRAFQKQSGQGVNGVVGAATWASLLKGLIAPPSISQQPLEYRCLALTGSFETSLPIPDCFAGLAGNFDGQGISFGALQWNLGTGTLQPLLLEMANGHPDVWTQLFAGGAVVLRQVLSENRADQLQWADSIQHQNSLVEPWKGQFRALGRTPEFQTIEMRSALGVFGRAVALRQNYQLSSSRATALMFDVVTQDGGIKPIARAEILSDYQSIAPSVTGGDLEIARMRSVATRVAHSANPKYVPDVLARKMTIANGSGIVHGKRYTLSGYGLDV